MYGQPPSGRRRPGSFWAKATHSRNHGIEVTEAGASFHTEAEALLVNLHMPALKRRRLEEEIQAAFELASWRELPSLLVWPMFSLLVRKNGMASASPSTVLDARISGRSGEQ